MTGCMQGQYVMRGSDGGSEIKSELGSDSGMAVIVTIVHIIVTGIGRRHSSKNFSNRISNSILVRTRHMDSK